MSRPSPATRNHAPLDAFVGVWETEGEVKSNNDTPSVKFTATDTYEWLPGGYFVLHRFTADMPDGNVQGIEVIGYSTDSQSFLMYSFDSLGNNMVMQGKTEGGKWIFLGECIRFTGSFLDDGKTFSGLWELRSSEEENWKPWMDVTLRKAGL